MQAFDPRHTSTRLGARLGPPLLLGAVGVMAMGMSWHLITSGAAHGPAKPGAPKPLDPAALVELQTEAFTQSARQPGFNAAVNVPVKVQPGETFEAAFRRIGVSPNEAHQVVAALAQTIDTVNIRAGLAFDAANAGSAGRRRPSCRCRSGRCPGGRGPA